MSSAWPVIPFLSPLSDVGAVQLIVEGQPGRPADQADHLYILRYGYNAINVQLRRCDAKFLSQLRSVLL